MSTSKPSGNLSNHNVHSNLRPLTIYRNDHRNNPHFLALHPNTIVLDRSAPRNVKKPHEHSSVSLHSPRTQTRAQHPTTQGRLPTPQNASDRLSTSIDNDDDNELEDLDSVEDYTDDDSAPQGTESSFAFHELTGEHYDPTADMHNYADQDRQALRDGVADSPTVEVVHPTDLAIDPSSFVLKRGQDGSAQFKASLTFGGDVNLEDYQVIVTKVTT